MYMDIYSYLVAVSPLKNLGCMHSCMCKYVNVCSCAFSPERVCMHAHSLSYKDVYSVSRFPLSCIQCHDLYFQCRDCCNADIYECVPVT